MVRIPNYMQTLKFLFVVLALSVFEKPLFSQRLIARGGLTSSWITFTGSEELKLKNGYGVGLGLELSLNKNFFIQPEIAVVTKGCNFGKPFEDTNFLIYYLEFPIPIKYYLGTTKFHAMLGPALSVGLGGKYHGYSEAFKIEFNGYPQDGYDLANLSYLDNRLDVSLQIGAGIELWNKIVVEIRYTHGFTRLYTDFSMRDGSENAANAYNRSFQFSVDVPFKVGKGQK